MDTTETSKKVIIKIKTRGNSFDHAKVQTATAEHVKMLRRKEGLKVAPWQKRLSNRKKKKNYLQNQTVSIWSFWYPRHMRKHWWGLSVNRHHSNRLFYNGTKAPCQYLFFSTFHHSNRSITVNHSNTAFQHGLIAATEPMGKNQSGSIFNHNEQPGLE